jgi:hypothetical protein
MNLYYRIIEHDEKDRTIVVRYHTDDLTEQELASSPDLREDGTPVRCRSDVALTIPIPEPSELGLHKMILRAAPKKALENLEIVKQNDTELLKLENLNKILNKRFKKTDEEYELLTTVGGPRANGAPTANSAFTPKQITSFLTPVNDSKN